MAAPKKEKVIFVNVRFPESVYRQLKKASKASKISPTEFCRNTTLAAVDQYNQHQQAA